MRVSIILLLVGVIAMTSHYHASSAEIEGKGDVIDFEDDLMCTDMCDEHVLGGDKEVPTKPGREIPTRPGREIPTRPGREIPTRPGREIPTRPDKEVPTRPGRERPTRPSRREHPQPHFTA